MFNLCLWTSSVYVYSMESNLQLTSFVGHSGGSFHTRMGTIYHVIRAAHVLHATVKFGSQWGMLLWVTLQKFWDLGLICLFVCFNGSEIRKWNHDRNKGDSPSCKRCHFWLRPTFADVASHNEDVLLGHPRGEALRTYSWESNLDPL